ncbi:MAG: hypothetical protein M3296_11030 [Actinomycetota bacterium]|nr:hypothetical protein [Actinomycetota bacterium]
MAIARNVDLVLLALALPIFVLADLPLLGCATAGVIWLMWRGIGAYAERRAAATADLARVAGYATGSMILRGWLMGLILVGSGLAFGDDVGLSAAILCVVLFTTSFAARLALNPSGASRSPLP